MQLSEYNYLLSSQLAQQRHHFQAQLRAVDERHRLRLGKSRAAAQALAEEQTQLQRRQTALAQAVAAGNAKAEQLDAEGDQCAAQVAKLKALNKSLTDQQVQRR